MIDESHIFSDMNLFEEALEFCDQSQLAEVLRLMDYKSRGMVLVTCISRLDDDFKFPRGEALHIKGHLTFEILGLHE